MPQLIESNDKQIKELISQILALLPASQDDNDYKQPVHDALEKIQTNTLGYNATYANAYRAVRKAAGFDGQDMYSLSKNIFSIKKRPTAENIINKLKFMLLEINENPKPVIAPLTNQAASEDVADIASTLDTNSECSLDAASAMMAEDNKLSLKSQSKFWPWVLRIVGTLSVLALLGASVGIPMVIWDPSIVIATAVEFATSIAGIVTFASLGLTGLVVGLVTAVVAFFTKSTSKSENKDETPVANPTTESTTDEVEVAPTSPASSPRQIVSSMPGNPIIDDRRQTLPALSTVENTSTVRRHSA